MRATGSKYLFEQQILNAKKTRLLEFISEMMWLIIRCMKCQRVTYFWLGMKKDVVDY